jgi:hypothetical protein
MYAPRIGGTASAFGTQTISVNFDCCCCEEHVTGDNEPPEVELTQPLASIHGAKVEKGWSSNLSDDQAHNLPAVVRVRKANCGEGSGIIVFFEVIGQFNPNPTPPPFDWIEWGVRGAYKICCCCDPISGETTWSAVPERALKGGSNDPKLCVLVVSDHKPTCDADLGTERTVLKGVQ